MKTVETTFKLTYTQEQYQKAVEYINDMRRHPKRIFWIGKKNKSDEELVLSHIAHRILSGFYNNYDPTYAQRQIVDMTSQPNG